MYFKGIELRGFKSFVDETKLSFEQGITAIVGPNGCGKSNIADGLRWVLGEQSAKSMRGTKMEDFIFNGSAARKPTGFAEVSLTISNVNGAVTAHPYSEYEEITVTRKLYRNGDSEYMINKVPCRLKDIVDIFLDTGVNARALSIIEQGQVTRIVNSKPDDRKVFIDEAAGIMKYKVRRNAAMNKLELSQQNLLRIQDILGELERQRNSLNRQAKKAERYKGFKTEIRDCGLTHFSSEYQNHTGMGEEMERRLQELQERETSLQTELSTKRNNLETVNAGIGEDERAISEIREEQSRIESSIERNDNHRDLLTRHIGEARDARAAAETEIGQIETEIVENDGAIAERKTDLESVKADIESKLGESSRLRGEVEDSQKRLNDIQSEHEEGARETHRIMDNIAHKRDDQSAIKTKLEMSGARLDEIASKENELRENENSFNEKLGGLRGQLEGLEGEMNRAGEESARIKAGLEETGAALTQSEESVRTVGESLTKAASKLESLTELERNFEGYGEGVRNLMKLKEDGRESLSGVKGLLASGVRVKPEMEAAFAAALGSRLEAVITDGSGSMAEAITLLKQDKIGGASFVSADLTPERTEGASPPDHPALLGRALDFVESAGELPGAIRGMLVDTFIVSDLDSAFEIWKTTPGAFTLVTTGGEVIDSAGFVTGGSAGASAAGLVSRKRIIEELEAEIGQLQTRKAEEAGERDRLQEAKRSLEETLAESEKKVRKLEIEIVGSGNEIHKAEADLDRNSAALKSLDQERSRLTDERNRLTADLETLNAEISDLTRQKDETGQRNERRQEEIRAMRQKLDEAVTLAQEANLGVTELKGRQDNIMLDIQRIEGIKAAAIARMQRLKDGIRDSETKIGEMEGSIESLLAENVSMARDNDGFKERLGVLRDALEEKRQHAETVQKAINSLVEELESVQPQITDVSLKKSEAQMRVENIIEKADAEFNIPIEDLESFEISGIDLDEVSHRLTFLRGELSRIGDVNLSALEEYEQVNQRWEFLKTQRDDLVKSISDLHKTIESINQTTKKLFMDTFTTVSENFELIFKRLFGGGKAEMKLVHEEGKSEPGIEIMVQPPGKRNQSLNLLSAGEKAMTAIALLFSVFLTKPSPFCLLDEIDAPLDEANIGRFRDLLHEMRERTQFIIITHSQKTMSFADRLYGVTQEEEGVSKILAVNLKDERTHPTPIVAA